MSASRFYFSTNILQGDAVTDQNCKLINTPEACTAPVGNTHEHILRIEIAANSIVLASEDEPGFVVMVSMVNGKVDLLVWNEHQSDDDPPQIIPLVA
jgi:hypothetical protein